MPFAEPTPEASQSPRRGWQVTEKWQDGANGDLDPAKGCSALVRTLRQALWPPRGARPTPQSFWRKAASRGGQLADFLSPKETCELLSTLAEARLHWEEDPAATKGLQRFAAHSAQELGSYSPEQVGMLAWAIARLTFQDEELLQAFSRRVEHTVRAERGRLSNEAACMMLASYRRMRVVDEAVLKSLSRLICRRLVREPLTPQQTTGVVAAYADLRARDLFLFNAATLALCRPNAVEALSWEDLADTTLAFASLRLYSATLFSRIRRRICDSAGVAFEESAPEMDLETATELCQSPAPPENGCNSPCAPLWDQITESVPPAPAVSLPHNAVARLLEAHLHLNRIGAWDLAPLLPHLAHPVHSRPPVELATLLAVALGRGGHSWPWLWRKAAVALARERNLAPRKVLSLGEALSAHLACLSPLLDTSGRGSGRRGAARKTQDWRNTDSNAAVALAHHLQVIAGSLAHWWEHCGLGCPGMSDAELQHVVATAPGLMAAQVPIHRWDAASGRDPLRYAAAQAVQRLGAECLRRRVATKEELALLLDPCNVDLAAVRKEAQRVVLDLVGPGAA